MFSEEIKQLLEMSGGKVVISQGDIKDSYVVIKLNQYLDEFKSHLADNKIQEAESKIAENLSIESEKKCYYHEKNRDLTDIELLDKINSDIEELRLRKMERDVENIFEERQREDDFDYDYI